MSNDKKFDVFGVGNAIVDILAQVPDQNINDLGLAKGGMTLMDTEQQSKVLQTLEHQNLQLASGGSAANTIVAVAQSGGKGVYVGKVAHDMHGEFYKRDIEEAGITFPVPLAPEAALPTGTSVILTTPDTERTMCTHLGISATISADDIDLDLLSQSKLSYIEGYLWSGPDTQKACIKAFEESNRLGLQTAFTFSDMFLVDGFRDDFKRIVQEYCDIVFCNSDEAMHFFETDDLEVCQEKLAPMCKLAFLTDGPNGCYVMQDGNSHHVDGFKAAAVDTVGAGDAFAGGALYGLTNGLSPTQSARWGNYFASKVVEIIGPRTDAKMNENIHEIANSVVSG